MPTTEEALVILTPGFAASAADSTCLPMHQRFVASLKRVQPSWKIIVLAFHYPFTDAAYDLFGADVIPLNGQNRGGFRRIFREQRALRVLHALNRRYRLRGLLSFWYGECASVGYQFAKRHNLAHYCWVLGQDARAQNKYPRKLKLPGDMLVALSDSLASALQQHHGVRPAHVIPPGIDTVGVPIETARRDIHLLAVGSLIPLKRFHLFIELVAALRSRVPLLRAVLVGHGPERERLSYQLAEYDLVPCLQLKGALPHADVLALMERSRLLIHPSSYEGYSGVCQEALSRGTPVISFTNAMDEAIEGWHLVSTPGEMIELADRLLHQDTVYSSPGFLTMEETARQFISLFESGARELSSSKERG